MSARDPTAIAPETASPRDAPPVAMAGEIPPSVPIPLARRNRITLTIATVTVAVAALLILVKTAAWLVSGSVSLLASLADSALDLAISTVTWFAVRYAAKPPDDEHRFGHGKAEAFAGLFQAGAVALSTVVIVFEAMHQLASPEPVRAGFVAIGAMVFSLVMTAGLVVAQTWAIRQTGSLATSGERTHYLADFLSNVAVIAGIVAATVFGLAFVDALIGLGVAVLLAHGAFRIAISAADQLMDHEADAPTRAAILAAIGSDPGILGITNLRSRLSGPLMHVEADLLVASAVPLIDAHLMTEAATARIAARLPGADIRLRVVPDGVGSHAGAGTAPFPAS